MPGMLASPHLEDLGGVLRLYSGFMDHHLSDVRERTFDAYATGDHALVSYLSSIFFLFLVMGYWGWILHGWEYF